MTTPDGHLQQSGHHPVVCVGTAFVCINSQKIIPSPITYRNRIVLALLVGVVCLLLGLWESVVRLPGVMRVLLPGDVLVSSRFGASC